MNDELTVLYKWASRKGACSKGRDLMRVCETPEELYEKAFGEYIAFLVRELFSVSKGVALLSPINQAALEGFIALAPEAWDPEVVATFHAFRKGEITYMELNDRASVRFGYADSPYRAQWDALVTVNELDCNYDFDDIVSELPRPTECRKLYDRLVKEAFPLDFLRDEFDAVEQDEYLNQIDSMGYEA